MQQQTWGIFVATNHLYPIAGAEYRIIQFNVIFDSELIKLVQKNPNHNTMIHVEKPTDKKLSDLQVMSWPIWEKEISEFPWEYDTKETCYIIEGEVVVTPETISLLLLEKATWWSSLKE